MKNKPYADFPTWDEVRPQLYTSQEIIESDLQVALLDDKNRMEKQIIKDTAKEMKARAEKILPDKVYKGYLYGSCARGDYSWDSDIDVLIILDCEGQQLSSYTHKLLDISDEISLRNEVNLSLQTSVKNEWLKYKDISLYYRNILREGMVV